MTGTRQRGGRARLATAMAAIMVVAAFVALTDPATSSHAIGPDVRVASAMLNIRPDTAVNGLTSEARLFAARNEAESFQIVVSGPATNVKVEGDPFGWGTTMLYRVGYYEATQKSDREGGTGRWGDALIPDRDVVYHEKRNAFPFDVQPGRTQVVWVDVFVPPNAPAGVRSGFLSVTSGSGQGAVTTPVAVSIDVLDWTMPASSSLKNAFYESYDSSVSQLCTAHTGSGTCGGNPTTLHTLHSLYARMALDDRVTIANGSGLNYAGSPTGPYASGEWETLYEAPVVHGSSTQPPGATWRLAGARASVVSQYAYNGDHCDAACASNWKAEANEPGQSFADDFYFYACDEPGGTAAKWNSCTAGFAPAHAAWPEAKSLVTAPVQLYAQRPAGNPAAQVLVVLSQYMEGKPEHPGFGFAGNQRPAYDEFLSHAGNEVWMYTACDSFSCDGDPLSDDHPQYDGWPGYSIDAPAVQSRAESWMVYKYDASGELYWNVNQTLPTAWNSGGQYFSGGNGDGNLFYPGTPALIGGPAGSDIPVESIRLKRIRDGREDYEYMHHLTELGRGAEVRTIVDTLFPHLYDAVAAKDGEGQGSLVQARQQLVQLLRTVTGSSPGRIAFSSDRDGDYELFTMNADGSSARQLSANVVSDRRPVWSPDGTQLAWAQATDIVRASDDGSATVNLTADISDVADKPLWSVDGSAILFVRTVAGHFEIWTMSLDGLHKAPLIVPTGGVSDVYDPTMMADHSLVFSAAVGANRVDLMASDPAGANVHPIPNVNGPGIVNEAASASGVGSTITYSRSLAGAQYDVFAVSVAGSGMVELSGGIGGASASDFDSDWSVDDSGIVLASNLGGDNEIWRVGSAGTGEVQLTANAASDVDPSWGPPARIAPVVPPTTPTTTPTTSPPPPTAIPGPGASPQPIPQPPGLDPATHDYIGLRPARLLDTREEGLTIDGSARGGGEVVGDSVTELTVAGRGGVAADAAAAMLNVTVTEPEGTGFLTVFPCGSPRPTSSNINFVAGQTVANAVATRLGSSGRVCLYSQRTTHLVVDVNGYFPASTSYRALVPARVLDSRVGHGSIDDRIVVTGPVPSGNTVVLPLSGRGGVGLDAVAASLNVTAVDSAAPGYATVFPCGAQRPTASNLNFSTTQAVPNAVVTKIGDDGNVCIFVSQTTELVIDVNGDFPSVSELAPLVPDRFLDTRMDASVIDGLSAQSRPLSRERIGRLAVAGRGGVGTSATSVILDVTATEPSGNGFLTVFDCGGAPPTASSLNFSTGQTVANLVVAQLAGDGSVCFFSNSDTHLVVDVVGYYS